MVRARGVGLCRSAAGLMMMLLAMVAGMLMLTTMATMFMLLFSLVSMELTGQCTTQILHNEESIQSRTTINASEKKLKATMKCVLRFTSQSTPSSFLRAKGKKQA